VEQQASHWITIAVIFSVGLTVLLFNMRSVKERRSLGQWLILQLYKVVRFGWAVLRAVDVGYLEYRRTVQETPLLMENERFLGKIVKATAKDEEGPAAGLHWDTAAN
jgi:hypothetical protein